MSEQDSVSKDGFIVGHTIKVIRRMTKKEMQDEGWSHYPPPTILVLDNDILLYPSRDAEGNGPGRLFGLGLMGTDKRFFYLDYP